MASSPPQRILISRTDALGDLVLTLPLLGLLRHYQPHIELHLLVSRYALPIAQHCRHAHAAWAWEDWAEDPVANLRTRQYDAVLHVFPRRAIAHAAWQAGIPRRYGSRSRWYHWYTCNRLVALTRRNSNLHEAQLNLRLAGDFLSPETLKLPAQALAVYYGLNATDAALPSSLPGHYVVLHPYSGGSAREWPEAHFISLAKLLADEGMNLVLTGTAREAERWQQHLPLLAGVPLHNLMGQLNLEQLMRVLAQARAVVAASTGPLHLAAALGTPALGLYPPIRPMDPGRWAPLGQHTAVMVQPKECSACRKTPTQCACMQALQPHAVASAIRNLL